jgi:hypothetical protein
MTCNAFLPQSLRLARNELVGSTFPLLLQAGGRSLRMPTELSRSGAWPGFQDVPNFGEQNYLGRRTCGGHWLRRFLEAVHLLDNQEQAKSDDQEFDNRVNEDSVGKYGYSSIGSLFQRSHVLSIQHDKEVREIDPSENQADDRHEDIIDQRRNNFAKRGADNNANREVDYVSLKSKFPEFVKHWHCDSSVLRCEF